jgi:hypothetical protein
MDNLHGIPSDVTTEQIVKAKLKPLIDEVAARIFEKGFTDWTEEQVIGSILSKYFDFEASSIIEAAAYGLEDANYHEDANVLHKMAYEDV